MLPTIQTFTLIQKKTEIRTAKLENKLLACIQLYSFLSPSAFNSQCRTVNYVNVCSHNSNTEITIQIYIEFYK